MRNTCERCRFFEADPGECRFHAPVVFLMQEYRIVKGWPPVENTDWCGEFQASERPNVFRSNKGDQAIADTLARRKWGDASGT
jgi:hypothetical protein